MKIVVVFECFVGFGRTMAGRKPESGKRLDKLLQGIIESRVGNGTENRRIKMRRTKENTMVASMQAAMIIVLSITLCTCGVVDYLMGRSSGKAIDPENAQNYIERFSSLQNVLLKAKDKDEVEIELSPLIKIENIDFKKGGSLNLTGDNSPKRITIDGNGRIVNVVGSRGGILLTVFTDTVLTLRNITLQGLYPDLDPDNDEANNTMPLVYVYDGELILGDGAVIENNHFAQTGNSGGGGGVYVDLPGVLEMRGTSVIRNNEVSGNTSVGGGVRLGGQLIMNGGTIMHNKAPKGGGVYVNRGTVTDSQGNKLYAVLSNNNGDISLNSPDDVDQADN
jgi:hypothetical protein